MNPRAIGITFKNESQDGYDTVEWAAALPYSNGKVGMFGGSYVGATQYLAAIAHPPHLAGICPDVTASNYHDGWTYQGGAFEQWFNESWSTGLASEHSAPADRIQRQGHRVDCKTPAHFLSHSRRRFRRGHCAVFYRLARASGLRRILESNLHRRSLLPDSGARSSAWARGTTFFRAAPCATMCA